jgi:hypothetical protein
MSKSMVYLYIAMYVTYLLIHDSECCINIPLHCLGVGALYLGTILAKGSKIHSKGLPFRSTELGICGSKLCDVLIDEVHELIAHAFFKTYNKMNDSQF